MDKAVALGAQRLSSLVVLGAEVSFDGGHRRVAHAPLDHELLLQAGVPVGLALRVGPFPGPFESTHELTLFLAGLARQLVTKAQGAGLEPSELQIDFDCAASKLRGYLVWIEEIRKAVPGTPLTVTVLPSWIGHDGFADLVAAVPGYVLQVHSLERPDSLDDSLVLCDSHRSSQWVWEAARYGVPFRVALPTYGYVVAFGPDGRFRGLHAEESAPLWGEDTILRETRSDPDALSALVRRWTEERPAALKGIIWYRLPVDTDGINWNWPTLAAVIEGRSPRRSLQAEARRVEPCLYEILLRNDGERSVAAPAVLVRWTDARLVAGEAFGAMEWVDAGESEVQLRSPRSLSAPRLAPGESRLLGWLRMNTEAEIHVDTFARES